MFYFGVIFLVSILGIAAIVGRHLMVAMKQPGIVEEAPFFPRVSFAPIVARVRESLTKSWHSDLKPRLMVFSEKAIRRSRLIVLKLERHLFELAAKIRRKNGELNGRIIPESKNGLSDDQTRYNKYWDDLRKGVKKEE